MKTPADVLDFWFGEPARDVNELTSKMMRWFRGDAEVDDLLKREFGAEVAAAVEGRLDGWLAEPKGWLALLILLDQFTRNVYRGDPKMHAGDARAVQLTRQAILDGRLRALPREERHFAMMPLLHAEDLGCQAQFAEEYAAFLKDLPAELRSFYAAGTEQSEKYTEVIRRFGRFPHRNQLLGRRSTPEEEAFLVDWYEKAPPKIAREHGLTARPPSKGPAT